MARRERSAFILGKGVNLSKPKYKAGKGQRYPIGDTATPGILKAAAGCTKIIAASPFASATKKEILDFVAMHRKALIVLPGKARNTPSARQIQRVIRNESVVFAEGEKGRNGRPAFIVAKRTISRMPPQIFARKPRAADIDALAAVLPGRTIRMGKRKATFFICGELTAFNPNGRVKHNRKLDAGIVINPAHTLMGHWNHLGKKLERLSRGSLAVYVTNNTADHHLISDVRIYKDGKSMERHRGKNIAWSECWI